MYAWGVVDQNVTSDADYNTECVPVILHMSCLVINSLFRAANNRCSFPQTLAPEHTLETIR